MTTSFYLLLAMINSYFNFLMIISRSSIPGGRVDSTGALPLTGETFLLDISDIYNLQVKIIMLLIWEQNK